MQVPNASQYFNPDRFRKTVIVRGTLALFSMGALFFLPAWTLKYWQAWVYMLVLAIPLIITVRYLYQHDPALLERRMRMKERQGTQKIVIALSWPIFLAAFVIPGFDYRFHWSEMPLFVTLLADVLVLLGYLFVGLVFRTNSFASRVVEVEKGQKVISTGPYSLVRHPMYLGVLVFYLFSPLALGSYWAVIPALFMLPMLMTRINGEEKELRQNLEGYKEYMTKTKFRLVPGIW
jgi:protein-S-isoprenylcysteine O-methyltransferase Ste14